MRGALWVCCSHSIVAVQESVPCDCAAVSGTWVSDLGCCSKMHLQQTHEIPKACQGGGIRPKPKRSACCSGPEQDGHHVYATTSYINTSCPMNSICLTAPMPCKASPCSTPQLLTMLGVCRFFWQATFDTDGIAIGPERRAYLDTRLSRLWEMNSQVHTQTQCQRLDCLASHSYSLQISARDKIARSGRRSCSALQGDACSCCAMCAWAALLPVLPVDPHAMTQKQQSLRQTPLAA